MPTLFLILGLYGVLIHKDSAVTKPVHIHITLHKNKVAKFWLEKDLKFKLAKSDKKLKNSVLKSISAYLNNPKNKIADKVIASYKANG